MHFMTMTVSNWRIFNPVIVWIFFLILSGNACADGSPLDLLKGKTEQVVRDTVQNFPPSMPGSERAVPMIPSGPVLPSKKTTPGSEGVEGTTSSALTEVGPKRLGEGLARINGVYPGSYSFECPPLPKSSSGTAGSTLPTFSPPPSLTSGRIAAELASKYGFYGTELDLLSRELEKGMSAEMASRYAIGAEAAVYARLSDAVYDFTEPAPDPRLGGQWVLDRTLVESNSSGFQGAVYANTTRREVVIAFAGTQPNILFHQMDFIEDTLNDVWGAAGGDGQVSWAQRLAKAALERYNPRLWKVTVTGHSLGGRLAQLTAASLQLKAFTFNTASVSGTDFSKISKPLTSGITNILTRADWVNPLSRIGGTAIDVGRSACFDFESIHNLNLLKRHSIKPLADSLYNVLRVYEDKIVPALGVAERERMSASRNFNGTYYHEALRFGFRITGNTGITTVSNSPRYKVGDTMLRFNPTGPKSFTGKQFCTDGIFHPVTGVLQDDGSLDMTIQGCVPMRYTMIRSGAASTASTNRPRAPTTTQTSPAKTDIVHIGGNVRPGLSGMEVSQALGSTTEGSRLYAIQQMVNQDSIRSPLSAAEVALILKGTTASARAQGVVVLAKLIKPNLSGQESATVLGSVTELNEGSRQYAVKALATAARLGATGADTRLMLQGMTGSARAQSIVDIAKGLKDNLSGEEIGNILGNASELNEGSRQYAIQALARAGKIGLDRTDTEAALILKGTTGSSRAQAIVDITKFIQPSLSGQQVATLLGSVQELNEGSRLYAIQALAKGDRLGANGRDTSIYLKGTTGSARAQAIVDIAKTLKPDLSGQEAAAILGEPSELNEGSRLYAIQGLVRAGKLRSNLSGDDLTALLSGMTGSARAQGLAELTKR